MNFEVLLKVTKTMTMKFCGINFLLCICRISRFFFEDFAMKKNMNDDTVFSIQTTRNISFGYVYDYCNLTCMRFYIFSFPYRLWYPRVNTDNRRKFDKKTCLISSPNNRTTFLWRFKSEVFSSKAGIWPIFFVALFSSFSKK